MNGSWLSRIRQFTAPPTIADADEGRVARMLNTILWAAVSIVFLATIALVITFPDPGSTLLFMGPLLGMLLISLFFLRRGQVRLASSLFAFLAWVMIALAAAYYGGVSSPSFSALIVTILIAGLLLGGRAGYLFAALSIIVGVIIFYGETEGLLPLIEIPAANYLSSQAMIFILSTLLLSLALSSLNRALDKVRAEIEERKKIEQELRIAKAEADAANQAKSEFVSLVSHELKAPMTSIHGYNDLLLSGMVGDLTDEQRDFMQRISNNVARMKTLVSDLADISRIESGRLLLEFNSVHLTAAMEEVLQLAESQLEDKQQKLQIDVPPDLPPVYADYNRLIQILINLVNNAHKYTPEHGELIVRAMPVNSTGPEMVQIAVQDSGIGIHPDEQPNIFQKFFRAADQKARNETGTGLGLNITKQLVELQGGQIWFESEFREGTTFYFTLPVAQ